MEELINSMEQTMIENIVLRAITNTFKLQGSGYDFDTIHIPIPYIHQDEYKSIRRSARCFLSRAGYDGKEILSDAKLKEILTKMKIEIRGSVE